MKNTRMLNKEIDSHSNHTSSEVVPQRTTRQSGSAKSKTHCETRATVEVLYQKMGDRWFAFSLLGEDVFVGSISPDDLGANEGDSIPAIEPSAPPRKREIGLT
jgi:hypothetical protein